MPESPADEPPVDEPPADDAPAVEPPPADEPPADESPADEPPADDAAEAAPPPDEAPPAAGGTNGFAIASFVFGVIGGIPLAVIFGIVALVQVRRRGQRGRGLAIAGIVLAVLWAVAVVALVLAVAGDGAERDASGVITKAGSVAVTDLRPGDCANRVGKEGVARSVDAVPCAEPHDGEVFATFDLRDGDYPGDDDTSTMAEEGCAERIADYSTRAVEDDRLALFYFQPTEQSWDDGDREVVCLATSSEGKREGSLRD